MSSPIPYSKLEMEDFKKIMANPFYCINLDESLFGDHEPMVTKKEWAKIQVINILEDENGKKLPPELLEASIMEWALRLLDVLEGNYA